MKLGYFLAAVCIAVSLLACSCTPAGLALQPTADGCLMATTTTADGSTYAVGPCLDDAGKIASYRTTWLNPDGFSMLMNYVVATKHTEVKYLSKGVWIKWDSKCGVSLGGMPPPVELLAI
jgi:hypothetical protein